jgi:hypothetical protein
MRTPEQPTSRIRTSRSNGCTRSYSPDYLDQRGATGSGRTTDRGPTQPELVASPARTVPGRRSSRSCRTPTTSGSACATPPPGRPTCQVPARRAVREPRLGLRHATNELTANPSSRALHVGPDGAWAETLGLSGQRPVVRLLPAAGCASPPDGLPHRYGQRRSVGGSSNGTRAAPAVGRMRASVAAPGRLSLGTESGAPGASQPPAPSDPGVTFSRHRALLIGPSTCGPRASG